VIDLVVQYCVAEPVASLNRVSSERTLLNAK